MKKKKPVFKSFDKFCDLFSLKIDDVVENRNNYYIITQRVREIYETTEKKIFSAGEYLGSMKGKTFTPSFMLIDRAAKTSQQKVKLDDKKMEWLFLCERDIFKKNINTTAKGYSIVTNSKDEVLGIGFVDDKNLLNVTDRGNFLRRER
mgnify:CR=1 FL=1